MLADALQHIDQVGVGIDALELAVYQQALDDTDAFRADLGPAKQPVLFSSRDDPQTAFQMIGVDRVGGELLSYGGKSGPEAPK